MSRLAMALVLTVLASTAIAVGLYIGTHPCPPIQQTQNV